MILKTSKGFEVRGQGGRTSLGTYKTLALAKARLAQVEAHSGKPADKAEAKFPDSKFPPKGGAAPGKPAPFGGKQAAPFQKGGTPAANGKTCPACGQPMPAAAHGTPQPLAPAGAGGTPPWAPMSL